MSVRDNLNGRREVFAHRGASGKYFENTMKAFYGAVKDGADGIELDVQRSKDGVFFVIHDSELSRLSGVNKQIAELDAAEILQLRIGKRFLRGFSGSEIPTLSSVVSFASIEGIGLNIELKETISEHPDCLPELLDQISILDNVYVSSFDYNLIQKVKQIDSTMEAGLLLKKTMLADKELTDYPSADAFHFHKRMMKEPYLSMWSQTKKTIRVYGVDGNEAFVKDPPDFIDGWITDYPDRFQLS
ncbi:glycerophosphodiester phosphodiesterase [Sporosarcina sp. A2]|uniref:glycerophosphodiester phosphodiesterase n=1 Tax=Sporosarcina sp. A2 TaxID=3393449 RepID=UPI003D7BA504